LYRPRRGRATTPLFEPLEGWVPATDIQLTPWPLPGPAHLLHLPANSQSGSGDRINLPKSIRAAAGAPCGHVFTNRGVYTLKWIIPSGKFGEKCKRRGVGL